ncbi:hypothetical protein V0R50_10890 [Pseudomonas sp. 148P]|uniref:Secreted protein n=1 Tax=Pseudomonas ulcerans TaxID=3115852 RepID=A0ABU7HQB5_9PSED|nr:MULTISPECIES: hypothetical protein [unclassified Pseudomonas]MEE1922750.1 hypothetical protein [Pseudomonas sp. 147P]MEE1933727.1 hypothetical protein [Pseudomonas sp. 148P]
MNIVRVMAVAVVLSSVVGTAQAADGMERIQQFQAKFQAEQDRLWGDQSEQRKEQVVEKETATDKSDG